MELTSILETTFLVNVDSVVYAYERGSGSTLVMARNKEVIFVTESVSEVVTASGTGLVAFTSTSGDVTGDVAINPNYIQTATSVDDGDSSGLILADNSGVRATLVVTTDYDEMDAIMEASAGGTSYSVYTALLTQSGTAAPTATVLQNTLGGTVVWTRDDVGEYTATLAGAFTENKTWFSITCRYDNGYIAQAYLNSENDFGFFVENFAAEGTDDWTNISIEIRVYP